MRYLIAAFVLAVTVVTLASLSQTNSEAAWPGDNGKILFSEYPDGRIWTMDADGSNREPITNGPWDYNGSWSPDGTMIVFQRGASLPGEVGIAGGFQVWTVEADGSNPTMIGPGGDPSWSPDGTRIVYINNSEIHEMDAANGANDVTITQGSNDEEPVYSPDGSVIAFIRTGSVDTAAVGPAGFTATSEIYTVEPDGQNVQAVSDMPLERKYSPDWAPDGSGLIYSGIETNDIRTMAYPGGTTAALLPGSIDATNFDGVYSPDGSQIAFVVETPPMAANSVSPLGADQDSLWVMDADGSNPHQLPGDDPNQQEFSPDWQPIFPATPTPSPTVSPTPSPTPGPTPVIETLVWGDANCSDAADPVDALLTLRQDAGLSVNVGSCPPLGIDIEVLVVNNAGLGEGDGDPQVWGNVDCDTIIVSPIDALKILRYDAALTYSQTGDCPPIGSHVTIQYEPE